MPLYEYQCRSCGNVSETIQRMSDPPLTTCDACGGELKKLVSAPAFQFKGSGWYVTDYAGKGEKGGDSKGGDGKSASEGKESKAKDGDSKSDSGDSKSEKKASSETSKPEARTKSERIAS